MTTLTPLSASASSSSASEPVCYFLELDGARILLDLGGRDYRASAEAGSWAYEDKLRELAPTLSLVLLSHSPASYLSLYPYARARWGLTCPVYATQPTVEMGRVVCLAEAAGWRAECAVPADEDENEGQGESEGDGDGGGEAGMDVDPPEGVVRKRRRLRGPFVPTVEEIHEAFDWIKAIRYNQPLHLGGDLSHLLLTPFPSGHVLGGTLFKIRSPTSGTILYAVGMNHTGERHVDGLVTGQRGGPGAAGYADDIRRPDLLLVEAGRADVVAVKRRERETALLELVNRTLEAERSVLMPCDAAPRLLELLVLLDQHWQFKTAGAMGPAARRWNYPLCLVSRTAQDMAAFARSLIEWMGGVVREGDDVLESRRGRRRPVVSEYGVLDFRHVRFFDTPAGLLQAHGLGQPKLVLAVPPSMSHGPSRWLFTAMAGQAGNVIVLTSRGEDGTLARGLYDAWEAQTGVGWGTGTLGAAAVPALAPLALEMDAKVPLAGAELEAFNEAERLKKEREAAHAAARERGRRMLEADDLDSDSDTDDDDAGAVDGLLDRAADADDLGGKIAAGANANAFAGETDDRQMSFDIFVKGQQTRNSGRGAAGVGTDVATRFRMFPMVARGRKVDSYGEGLDIGQWVRKGREIEEEGETEEVRAAKRRKEEEEDKAKLPPEPPSKFVSETVQVTLRASVWYVDMEGQHDGQAIKTIISDLQPRKLVLIRSTPHPTQTLVSFFASRFAPGDVFCPATDERVRVGEHVQSYSLQLGDSIAALIKWSRFEGYEVAMVDGKMAFAAGSTVPTLEAASVALAPAAPEPRVDDVPAGEVTEEVATKTEAEAEGEAGAAAEAAAEEAAAPAAAQEGDSAATIGATDLAAAPTADASAAARAASAAPAPAAAQRAPLPLPASLYIGDLRLLALKSRLAARGVPAEFAGEGTLLCGPGLAEPKAARAGQVVAVRKVGEGEVVVEGTVGSVYWDVRRELYASYAQVVRL